MTPDQVTQLFANIDRLGQLVTTVLVLQGVIAVGLVVAHWRIAKNQVISADLLRQAVAQIESDLPGAGKK
jgi:hypothetical protein